MNAFNTNITLLIIFLVRLQIWKNDVAEQIKLPNKRKPVNLESRTEQTVADKKDHFTCKGINVSEDHCT